jgi:subtilase family protein
MTCESISNSKAKPLEAFGAASGRGVRVAVIDSGVNPKHPHIHGLAGGVAIDFEGRMNSYVDFLGHGTAVMAAIQEKAPDAAFYGIKICYRSLRTDISFLVAALRYAINDGVDVINLSMGTTNTIHYDSLIPAIQSANDAGILIVAAGEIDTIPALPGNLPGVIGVGVDWTCPRERFRENSSGHGPRWLASGYPRSLPGVTLSENFRGISFSVANMSGFVARACEITNSRTASEICEVLHKEAERLRALEEASDGL